MRSSAASIIVSLLMAACASADKPREPVMSGATALVVIARDATLGSGPLGVDDRFGLDGKMVAFVSFTWPQNHSSWGPQVFESRWYSGDRLVIKRETELIVSTQPYHFWSHVFPTDLGVGPGHYEVLAGGKKLAEKSFEIVGPALTQ